MKYGDLPKSLGIINIECQEMMHYQYLPIKNINSSMVRYESRIDIFDALIESAIEEFKEEFGNKAFREHFIYITAKHRYQDASNAINRAGWHSDGFLTNDINYIWSDMNPTIFNISEFNLTLDDKTSMKEMEEQALEINDWVYPDFSLVRLNQYNIHKVNDNPIAGFRTFVKISFSKDKYDLVGNSRNHINSNWVFKQRKSDRNIPQSNIINP
jgi:hypothetical protein